MSLGNFIRKILGIDDLNEEPLQVESEVPHRFIVITNDHFFLADEEIKLSTEIRFSEIKDAVYNDGKLEIISEKDTVTLLSTDFGWYEFLRIIPKNLSSFNYGRFDAFFGSLNGCKVCGLIAVNGSECLNCGFDLLNTQVSLDIEIKEKQLSYFSFLRSESIGLSNNSQSGFESDSNWKLLITDEDIDEWNNSYEKPFHE